MKSNFSILALLAMRPRGRASLEEIEQLGSAAEVRPEIRSGKGNVFPDIAAAFRRLGTLWRKHLEHELPDRKMQHRSRNAIGAVIALLSLMLLAICAGAAAVVMQFKSMTSEIAYLQREVLSLKERLTRIDQAERARQLEKASTERAKSGDTKSGDTKSGDNLAQEAALNLSADEIRLIRDYIKPAQSAGPAVAPTNVGDPIVGPTIPLPSPLTEKVPRLIGARFAIRNGAIIIVKRDSRRADAVLGPN